MFLMLFFIRRNDCAQLEAQMRMTMSLIMNGMIFLHHPLWVRRYAEGSSLWGVLQAHCPGWTSSTNTLALGQYIVHYILVYPNRLKSIFAGPFGYAKYSDNRGRQFYQLICVLCIGNTGSFRFWQGIWQSLQGSCSYLLAKPSSFASYPRPAL